MTRPELFPDTRDLLACLQAEGAEFVIVGAHALAAHGVPRATSDFDLLVRPTPENAARVYRALQRFGAPTQAHGVAAADFARPGIVYQMGQPPRRIDILTRISGVEFVAAWAGRLEVVVDGLVVPVLGRAELLANKRATGRAKDLLDVRALEGGEE